MVLPHRDKGCLSIYTENSNKIISKCIGCYKLCLYFFQVWLSSMCLSVRLLVNIWGLMNIKLGQKVLLSPSCDCPLQLDSVPSYLCPSWIWALWSMSYVPCFLTFTKYNWLDGSQPEPQLDPSVKHQQPQVRPESLPMLSLFLWQMQTWEEQGAELLRASQNTVTGSCGKCWPRGVGHTNGEKLEQASIAFTREYFHRDWKILPFSCSRKRCCNHRESFSLPLTVPCSWHYPILESKISLRSISNITSSKLKQTHLDLKVLCNPILHSSKLPF